MSLRVSPVGGCGSVNTSWAHDALIYAVNNGAWAINISWLVLGATPSQVAELASGVQYAWDHNVPVIAAAGNDSSNPFSGIYPAAFLNVITVGGTEVLAQDGLDHRWSDAPGSEYDDEGYGGSNWGYPGLDLAAPALDIWTTKDGGGTVMSTGTSFAAPLVAGVAFLMKSRHPTWTSAQIKARFQVTADEAGPYNYEWNANFCGGGGHQSAELGCGLLDAEAAVQ